MTADVIEGVVVEVGQGDALVNHSTDGLVSEIVQAMCDVIDGHKTIAEGMAQLRDEHKWTQRQIATEVGCSQATVSRHLEWLAIGDDRPLYGDRIKAIKAAKPEPVESPKPVEPEPVEVVEPEIVGAEVEIFAEPELFDEEPEPEASPGPAWSPISHYPDVDAWTKAGCALAVSLFAKTEESALALEELAEAAKLVTKIAARRARELRRRLL
jgi:hypothetical protein